jgi:hypothetical protein
LVISYFKNLIISVRNFSTLSRTLNTMVIILGKDFGQKYAVLFLRNDDNQDSFRCPNAAFHGRPGIVYKKNKNISLLLIICDNGTPVMDIFERLYRKMTSNL